VQLSPSDLLSPHGSIRIQAMSVRQGRKRKATWRCHRRGADSILDPPFLVLLPSCTFAPVSVTSMPRPQTRELESGRRRSG
jgi:hypothetical protein